jgi:hypothetical protein
MNDYLNVCDDAITDLVLILQKSTTESCHMLDQYNPHIHTLLLTFNIILASGMFQPRALNIASFFLLTHNVCFILHSVTLFSTDILSNFFMCPVCLFCTDFVFFEVVRCYLTVIMREK